MQKKQLQKLIRKYRQGSCTSEEKAMLESWYAHYAKRQQGPLPDAVAIAEDLDAVWEQLPVHHRGNAGHRRTVFRYIAAAATLLLAGISIYMIRNADNRQQETVTRNADIAAENEAYILLDDRIKINLDSVRINESVEYGAVRIRKLDGETLVYDASASEKQQLTGDRKAVPNVINVPKTKQYDVLLPDGSKVKLNSLSSIAFPSFFAEDKREVTLKGEGYFDVVNDPSKPFHIHVGDVGIKVLGTRFNVSAYPDEAHIKTTLLSGSVEVAVPDIASGATAHIRKVLKPGEQATVARSPGMLNISQVNAEDAIAWVDGFISFENTDLESIMKKVARWYDIDVTYDGPIPSRRFTGGISKKAPLEELLQVLSIYDIRFLKTGNGLIIKQD